ncbi:MAG: DnaJ domain-containing protein [Bacteroidales bacterium]|nr:DnaJ domain-containing protein [Bacteroidales bacterium]
MLGIAPGSNLQQIKKAFREKAKLYHPDINHNPSAQDYFIQIREAFEMIVRQKQSRLYKIHGSETNFDFHKHPTYCHSPMEGNRRQYYRQKYPDFAESRQGKIIYCIVHVIFILTGFLIFIDPLIIAVQHQFDPYRPLYDSVFAAVITMVFGIVMFMTISLSLAAFIHKDRISKMK